MDELMEQVYQALGFEPKEKAPALPYPFCTQPEKCAGKGCCQRDPCCAD